MSYWDCLALIEEYLEEPNNINREWVECLLVCRRLLQKEIDHEKRLEDYGLKGKVDNGKNI